MPLTEHWPLWQSAQIPAEPGTGRELPALICVAQVPDGTGTCGLLAFTLEEAIGRHGDGPT